MTCDICGNIELTYYVKNNVAQCYNCAVDNEYEQIIDNYENYMIDFLSKNKPELIEMFLEVNDVKC